MSEQADSPRLYLVASADIAEHTLREALQAGDVACLLLRDATGASAPLVRAAQEMDVAVLVQDDVALVETLQADGLHLGPGGNVKTTRKRLGDEGIVGACCGNSRHAAMLAGEAGADYVAFAGREDEPGAAANPEILGWWQVMMELPCVAMGDVALVDTGPLAEAGADFVALGTAVWDHPQGPATAVAEATHQLQAVKRD
jgi:thiamine-phosphate pyrophosphorylase